VARARSPTRRFSAPSKESIHLSLLAVAIAAPSIVKDDSGALARQWVLPDARKEQQVAAALDTLQRKLFSYRCFNASFPGYAGFLPWFSHLPSDRPGVCPDIAPTPDWLGKVPSLDNGQWAWSLLAAAEALYSIGSDDLGAQYEAYAQVAARAAGWHSCRRLSDCARACTHSTSSSGLCQSSRTSLSPTADASARSPSSATSTPCPTPATTTVRQVG
jgi:hypothetical protein